MKLRTILAALALSLSAAACTNVPTATFNDKAGLTVETITAARQVEDAAFKAGDVHPVDDVYIRAQFDAAVAGLKAAKAIQAADPAAASAALAQAIATFKAAQAKYKSKP